MAFPAVWQGGGRARAKAVGGQPERQRLNGQLARPANRLEQAAQFRTVAGKRMGLGRFFAPVAAGWVGSGRFRPEEETAVLPWLGRGEPMKVQNLHLYALTTLTATAD